MNRYIQTRTHFSMTRIRAFLLISAMCILAMTAVAQQSKSPRARILMLTLYRNGFSSARVDLLPGPFQIQVRNQAGLKTLNLSLEQKGANNLTSVLKSELVDRLSSLHWIHDRELSAGTYIQRETTNPSWTCQIVVSAQGK